MTDTTTSLLAVIDNLCKRVPICRDWEIDEAERRDGNRSSEQRLTDEWNGRLADLYRAKHALSMAAQLGGPIGIARNQSEAAKLIKTIREAVGPVETRMARAITITL